MHLNGFDSKKHASRNAELSALRAKLMVNESSIEEVLLAAQREEEAAEVPSACNATRVIQKSVNLKYEPASEPLHMHPSHAPGSARRGVAPCWRCFCGPPCAVCSAGLLLLYSRYRS